MFCTVTWLYVLLIENHTYGKSLSLSLIAYCFIIWTKMCFLQPGLNARTVKFLCLWYWVWKFDKPFTISGKVFKLVKTEINITCSEHTNLTYSQENRMRATILQREGPQWYTVSVYHPGLFVCLSSCCNNDEGLAHISVQK